MMERQEWLDSLQEGDKVAIDLGGFSRVNYSITKITKITPSRRFEISYGNRKFNNNGLEIGKNDARSSRIRIEPVTQQVLEDIKTKEILSLISNTNFKTMSYPQLLKVEEAIKNI